MVYFMILIRQQHNVPVRYTRRKLLEILLNQSENGKYNLISVSFNKVSKRFICVHQGRILQTIYMRIRYIYIFAPNNYDHTFAPPP